MITTIKKKNSIKIYVNFSLKYFLFANMYKSRYKFLKKKKNESEIDFISSGFFTVITDTYQLEWTSCLIIKL